MISYTHFVINIDTLKSQWLLSLCAMCVKNRIWSTVSLTMDQNHGLKPRIEQYLFFKNILYVMDQAAVSGLSLRRLIIEITHRMTLASLKSSPLVTFKVRVNRRQVHILSNQVHQSDDMCSRLVNFTDIRSRTRFFHPSYISFHGGQN